MEQDTISKADSPGDFMNRFQKNARIFIWIFIFSGTGILLFFALPGEPRFKYEYQKGAPWKHESLVAPFDFAIQKSSQEMDRELEEESSQIIPYFECDTMVVHHKLLELETDWFMRADSSRSAYRVALEEIKSFLRTIYQSGVLPKSPESIPELFGKTELKRRVGPLVTKVPIISLYSEKSAYNDLKIFLMGLEKKKSSVSAAILSLKPEKYIASNLIYDQETTQRDIDEAVKNFSKTRGMLHAGDRIILEGEIVTDEKFQLLESLKYSFENERGEGINRYMLSIGKAVLLVIFMVLIFLFLYIYRPDVLSQYRRLLFLMIFLTGMVILTLFIDSFPSLNIYLVPLAIFPIVIRTFFDSRTAIFTLVVTCLIIGFYAPNNYEFVLLEVTAGIVAVFSLNKMHRRGHLIRAAGWVFITYVVVYSMISLVHEGSFHAISYRPVQWFFVSSLLILLVYPLVFIFEKIFGFVSDVTLIELSDTNQPLLRKLAEEAPGTFQHSMQIANLSEDIILKIGGNPFLVRAGSLYHDIGKIARPEYFIENQELGINPHDKMDHLNSAKVIISHVDKGVQMAKKHKLPDALIEFIATHHGTTKAQYFYLKHQENNPGEKVNEQPFIYPGPLPQSKEAAVVMIVDGIEAASRSLKEKSLDNLKELIDKMVDQKIRDNQLEQSNLTFRDIKIIKETLLNKLKNIYHVRIEYPKEQGELKN